MGADEFQIEGRAEVLWQCMGQSKRPLGLLLGAGCPASITVVGPEGDARPLIPAIAGLTQLISESISSSNLADEFRGLIGQLTEDQSQSPNLEVMLTRLRTLSTVVGTHDVRGLTGSSINALEAAITEDIKKAVSVDLPAAPTPYDDVAVWMRGTSRSYPVSVFTTNYDLLMETALERREMPFFDGFVGSREPFLDVAAIEHDSLPDRWARVWKLHGSSNWSILPSGKVVRAFAKDGISRSLIHPSHLKYDESRRMPYLIMQDRLRHFLTEPSATLVTVGFSFEDAHMNELIVEGIQGNPGAAVFALQHGQLARYANARDLALENPNLSCLARDAAVIARAERSWAAPSTDAAAGCDLGDFTVFGERLRALVGEGASATGVTGIDAT
jgi:hypothetical protein